MRGRSEGGKGEGGRGTRESQGGRSRHGREIPGEHRDLPPVDLSLPPLLLGSLALTTILRDCVSTAKSYS